MNKNKAGITVWLSSPVLVIRPFVPEDKLRAGARKKKYNTGLFLVPKRKLAA